MDSVFAGYLLLLSLPSIWGILKIRSLKFDDTIFGIRLEGDLIASHLVPRRTTCITMCTRTAGCLSYSFCGDKSCRLHSEDRHLGISVADSLCVYNGKAWIHASWGDWTKIGEEFDADAEVWTIMRSRHCLEDRSGNIVENRYCGEVSGNYSETGYRWEQWNEVVEFDSDTEVWTYTNTRSCLEDISGNVTDYFNCGADVGGNYTVDKYKWGPWNEVVEFDSGTKIWTYTNTRDCLDNNSGAVAVYFKCGGGVGGNYTVEKYRWSSWNEIVDFDSASEVWTYTNTRDCLDDTSGAVVDYAYCGEGAGGHQTVDKYRWGPWTITGETFDDLMDTWTITKSRTCVDDATGGVRDSNFCGGGTGGTAQNTFRWNTSPVIWTSGKSACTNFPGGGFLLWGDIEGTMAEFDAVYAKLEISGELNLGIERLAGTSKWMTVSGNEVAASKMNWAGGFPSGDTSQTLRVYVTRVGPSYYELKHDAGSLSRKYICMKFQYT